MDKSGGRSEKSLSALTKKFVELLKTQPTVDLNAVSAKIYNKKINFHEFSTQATKTLQSSRKRRIYDITNVMEGVGLIKKVAKNTYQVRMEMLMFMI